jgi:predicted  nucleic acid-binding Zn-ribbon protein
MGQMLDALLHLQSIERQLAHLRARLRSRENAVATQQRRIQQLEENYNALNERSLEKRKEGDRQELDLKIKEQQVARLRTNLNTARTNKEYAAILTQINTLKADNSRLEESALRIMQEADAIKADADKIHEQIEAEQRRLEDIRRTSAEEVQKLTGMMEDLGVKRAEAAEAVPREALAVFERIADNYDGEAMALIEVHGNRPPHDYICGGCYMSLTAEHANALRVRDEIRTCDNCGRILYLEAQAEQSRAQ